MSVLCVLICKYLFVVVVSVSFLFLGKFCSVVGFVVQQLLLLVLLSLSSNCICHFPGSILCQSCLNLAHFKIVWVLT